jgi:hypothetical protein
MIEDNRPDEQTQEQIRAKPRRRKLRVRLFIFLLCLAISASMWVFIELMKDYTTDIPYFISFRNVPEDLILVNQDDSIITVGVNAQGFELLVAQYMRKRQTIEIDLADVKIRSGADGYTAIMPASRLKEQVMRQISFSKSITNIRPDTLMFRFSEIYRKQVPVISNIRYSFANQFQLSDSIRIDPRYVMVSSIKDVIDTIRFVTTDRLELDNLDSNLTITLPLRKTLRNNMIRYSQDTVAIKIKVERFTEAVLKVPVSITGNILPIRIYPDEIDVSCQVPLSQYKELDASQFAATVIASPGNLAVNKNLMVVLTKVPANVRSVRFKPDKVEYIIISK